LSAVGEFEVAREAKAAAGQADSKNQKTRESGLKEFLLPSCLVFGSRFID
jgi:hypothetical protein